MNQKEIGELRRRWRPEKNAVSEIYGCLVNSAKQIVSDWSKSLGRMSAEESEKYLSLLKKALSGTPEKQLLDIVFTTQQVADSEEHRLLSALRESGLQDETVRGEFYRKVVESLDMGDQNYLLLLACDTYDVPRRRGDDRESGSETVFSYILCCVCPVKQTKPELEYFSGDNEFHYTAGQVVSAPELGFLFPAFDDRTANLYNALYYIRRPEKLHPEFLEAIFHTEPPMSSVEQRETFQRVLCESLEETCDLEVVRSVHAHFAERLNDHKESGNPEALTVTWEEVGGILRSCGVEEERVNTFRNHGIEAFGEGAVLHPANLIDVHHYQVKTGEAILSVEPSCSYLVESRVIDGKKYLLIPAGEDVEVNGMAVRLLAEEEAV